MPRALDEFLGVGVPFRVSGLPFRDAGGLGSRGAT
jgi:hypothetical protein